jgi:hypothetical protein
MGSLDRGAVLKPKLGSKSHRYRSLAIAESRMVVDRVGDDVGAITV